MNQAWLNSLSLSKKITNIGKDFKDGFLFGEILSKYGMKHDFGMFQSSQTSEIIHKNFLLLEPAFRTLGITFNPLILERAMKGDEAIIQGILSKMRLSLSKANSENEKNRFSPKICITSVTEGSLFGNSTPSPKSMGEVSVHELESHDQMDSLLINTPKKPKVPQSKGDPLKLCFKNHRRFISKTEIVGEKNPKDEKSRGEYILKLKTYVSEKTGFTRERKSIPNILSRALSPTNAEIHSPIMRRTPSIFCSPIRLPELVQKGNFKISFLF